MVMLLFFCEVTRQMERFFPLLYGKDHVPKASKGAQNDSKGAIAKATIQSNFWAIVEIEVAKLQVFNNGLDGVRYQNAMDILRIMELNIANNS